MLKGQACSSKICVSNPGSSKPITAQLPTLKSRAGLRQPMPRYAQHQLTVASQTRTLGLGGELRSTAKTPSAGGLRNLDLRVRVAQPFAVVAAIFPADALLTTAEAFVLLAPEIVVIGGVTREAFGGCLNTTHFQLAAAPPALLRGPRLDVGVLAAVELPACLLSTFVLSAAIPASRRAGLALQGRSGSLSAVTCVQEALNNPRAKSLHVFESVPPCRRVASHGRAACEPVAVLKPICGAAAFAFPGTRAGQTLLLAVLLAGPVLHARDHHLAD